MADKDLFSQHAEAYALYRPTYPRALFNYLAGLCADHSCAWDCATGNGQAALALTPYFQRIIATDLSPQQLRLAPRHPRLDYRVATAENSGLAPQSVNLITVAQAMHWFTTDAFFQEVQRVLAPAGIFATWCYALQHVNEDFDRILRQFYEQALAPYWEPERILVEQGYAGIQLPFQELETPRFTMQAEWDLDQYLGYLRTWSAVRKAMCLSGKDPLIPFIQQWESTWGPTGSKLQVEFPLFLRVVRRPAS